MPTIATAPFPYEFPMPISCVKAGGDWRVCGARPYAWETRAIRTANATWAILEACRGGDAIHHRGGEDLFLAPTSV